MTSKRKENWLKNYKFEKLGVKVEDFQFKLTRCSRNQGLEQLHHFHSKSHQKLFFFVSTAMALEQLQSAGELEVSDDDIIACYECAGDIGLWLITDQTSLPRPAVTSQIMPFGRTLEIALQRAPILLIKNG